MISIPNCIQRVLSEFVVDEVVHTLSSVMKTSMNSKFILEIIQVLYSVFFFFSCGQLSEDLSMQTF